MPCRSMYSDRMELRSTKRVPSLLGLYLYTTPVRLTVSVALVMYISTLILGCAYSVVVKVKGACDLPALTLDNTPFIVLTGSVVSVNAIICALPLDLF